MDLLFLFSTRGALAVLVILTGLYLLRSRSKKKPPGPYGLPLVGSLPWMMLYKPHVYLMKLAEKYGPAIYLKLGSLNFVYINEYETMKKFITCNKINQRPEGTIFKDESGFGVSTSDGELWKHNRRFVLTCLKDAGVGQLRVQEKLQEEILCMNERIMERLDQPFCISHLLKKSSSNIISLLAFGDRYEYDDPKQNRLIELFNEGGELAGKLVLVGFFPRLMFLARGAKAKLGEAVDNIRARTQEIIGERRKLMEERQFGSCFLDLYLQKLADGSDNMFSERYLEDLMIDLFVTGMETVSITVTWALMYMAKYPDIQSNVQKEIDEVIGGDRFPQIEDKPNLPVTISVIQEVERVITLLRLSFPRTSDCPVNVLGYDFEPGTNFVMNLYAVSRDPKLWKDPEKFDPSRFIDSKGKAFRPPYLIPFGMGRRSCMGESLAKMELFLYFAFLMQRYSFHAPDADFSLEELRHSFVATPVHKNIVARLRSPTG